MPSSSTLTERITLQQRSASVDALGQQSTSWSDVATVWAEVLPLSARDFQAAEQTQASSTIRVHIRQRAGVAATMRIQWDGRAWDIVGEPLPIARTWLRFDAVSGVRDAR